ncbi:TadE/TadG family type IV pilus assembly protein [Pontivivens insulae]|uniref:TadE-like domain-containing protein n=1 Tax=Pontivivens insulae TaxID=1639689 RepID=A0A2R8A8Q8_9RHOB|nr:TadE/TadG family type IV pilus assembly protein [Pontivivens insulae]RED18713.1 Flp pilus assembly protein TadG [Pontivivens insulae]SPF28611.1 hypothetical protein POI8812_00913 [Pontivivens insulae]
MLKVAFDRMRSFWRRDRGAITVEFVVTLPILLAVLMFVQQYGEAMRIRNAMDIGVRDAARFLSRAPIDEVSGGIPETFVCRARTIVTDRLAIYGATPFSASVDGVTADGCSGLYIDDATGDAATYDDGALIADALLIVATEDAVAVSASYGVQLTFAQAFASRKQDVVVTLDNLGNTVQTLTARTDLPEDQEDLNRSIIMTVIETWPRTQ